ncbi:MAG TPA: glycosyltransferase family 4 protein [Candidatus Binataceae bacterium]|nr:glycosyltransferase family 4 protein [Candidatus Binataceae bacterium]
MTDASRKTRVAYLVTHPIQYQAPLLRLIAAQPDLDLAVFFQSDLSVKEYRDPGFGRVIKWDVDLLDGYHSEFLPALGRRDMLSALRPLSYGIGRRLWRGQFDVLWVHGYARWFNWVALCAARRAGIPVLLRDEATPISAERSAAKVWLKRTLMFRALDRLVAGFLAIGTLNRRYYEENSIVPARVFDLPYCVDNQYFASRAAAATPQREALRARLGLEPGRPVILYASKLQARKRAGDLLAAFERLSRLVPRPYLVVIGDGEERATLEARAAPLGGDVRFLGFLNQSELPAYFDLCDVFVLPSVQEPWGLIVNEVMNAGRAVVASDQVGCAPDLVKDGVNGFVYPAGDAAALADALRRVLTDRATVAAMGRASAAIIADWDFTRDLAGLRAAIAFAVGRSWP